ncbi:FAD/NAD(P)-binding domain-containing protein [Trametopsis cervina]|nr:FAD/NAD(P)-binding domain-containing protein [Trametopsis cervina]
MPPPPITPVPEGVYLPTFDNLGVAPVDAQSIDAKQVGQEWLSAFSTAVAANDIPGILATFHDKPWWRDLFALTWDLRTFFSSETISTFLTDRLALSKFKVGDLTFAEWHQPWPDLGWVCIQFEFETEVGTGHGIVRLVPTPQGYRALLMATNLEDLKGYPEKVGPLRDQLPSHGKWLEKRKKEQAFEDVDPEVLIVGGGQSGLDIAARLKMLGISHLIVEKNPRIGDLWRNRYEALCLHDNVWFTHMPYLPFPPNWPVYAPSQKVHPFSFSLSIASSSPHSPGYPQIADWLEFFSQAMELNIWNSSTVTKASKSADTGKWDVTVRRADGSERVFHVDHLIFALGLGAGKPYMPDVPGREEFQGQVLHSTEHHSAKDHAGKKVVVVGACVSAHDICSDYADHDVDVTMIQRSSTYVMTTKNGVPTLFKPNYWEGGPPTEIADRLDNSIPIIFSKLIAQRQTKEIADADKVLLEGLAKSGYSLNYGEEGSGFLFLALKRAGGYYLDVGAAQKIVDGKIKVKSSTEVERYTPTGLKFTDGSELEADVVLFATGYVSSPLPSLLPSCTTNNSVAVNRFDDPRKPILSILGDEYDGRLTPVWGLDGEGNTRTAWRELGPDVENAWLMMGNFAWCRFFSKHLALQIKAKQEGIFGTRYSAPIAW